MRIRLLCFRFVDWLTIQIFKHTITNIIYTNNNNNSLHSRNRKTSTRRWWNEPKKNSQHKNNNTPKTRTPIKWRQNASEDLWLIFWSSFFLVAYCYYFAAFAFNYNNLSMKFCQFVFIPVSKTHTNENVSKIWHRGNISSEHSYLDICK